MKNNNYKTEYEFYNAVADDCILHMRDKDKEYLINNPKAIEYHFSYCLFIRNHYIHNRDLSSMPFYTEPDYMSSEIIKMIFSKLLPEYIYGNPFVEELYDDDGFIAMRKAYKTIYNEYPNFLVNKYCEMVDVEPVCSKSERLSLSDVDFEVELEKLQFNHEITKDAIEKLVDELTKLVWREDSFKETISGYGISYDEIEGRIEEIKKIFSEEKAYIPLEICLLPYKKQIGSERYYAYRRALCKALEENPRLTEKIDGTYFSDRQLARSVLKYGWTLRYLPMYQNDDAMVKFALRHDGEAIEYVNKRFVRDREWVKFAIENSKNGTIMYLECMKPYRKDKELVYLACKMQRWNFVYVDKSYRDDFALAKICMEQIGNPNRIFHYLSKRLKGNKELAMIDLQEKFPDTEDYSAQLRNDDEIAEKLFELHGADSWAWYYMSKRLKKKYGIIK